MEGEEVQRAHQQHFPPPRPEPMQEEDHSSRAQPQHFPPPREHHMDEGRAEVPREHHPHIPSPRQQPMEEGQAPAAHHQHYSPPRHHNEDGAADAQKMPSPPVPASTPPPPAPPAAAPAPPQPVNPDGGIELRQLADVLRELKLTMWEIEKWALLQRTAFDVFLGEEPYHSIQLYINLESKKFLVRILGFTRRTGEYGNIGELVDLCRETFGNVVACVGVLDPKVPQSYASEEWVMVDYPCRRQISRYCEQYYKTSDFLEMSENERLGLGLCRACRAISQYEEKCKIDPATVASFLGNANVKREPGNEEDNGGPYDGGGGDDGPWPADGIGEQDIRQYMQVTYGRGGGGGDYDDEQEDEEDEDWDYKEHWNYRQARKYKKERIKAERKERRPRGPRRGGGKVEKTYSDVDGEPDMIECDICQERLKRHPRWVITNHNRRKHGLGRFLCGICDYKGRFGHELINHMAEDHAEEDPIVKCPCCQLELNFGRDAKLFDDHYRACKREKKKQENDGKSYLVPQMCPQCGKTLCSKQSLDNHLKVHAGDRSWVCDYPGCTKQFISKGALKIHKSKHLRENGLAAPTDAQCIQCGKIFGSRSYLAEHIALVHENKSMKVKCEHCDEILPNRTARTIHTNRVHFPDKHFCKICQKSFGHAGELRQHNLQHQAPDLKCPHCDSMFKRQQALVEHIRLHTGEKPFKCPYCDTYRAVSSSLLTHHKRANHRAEWARDQAVRRSKYAKRYELPESEALEAAANNASALSGNGVLGLPDPRNLKMSLRLDAPSLAQFPPQAHPMGPQHHAAQAHGGQPHPHPTPPPQDLEQKFIPPK